MKITDILKHLKNTQLVPTEMFWKLKEYGTLCVLLDGVNPVTGIRVHVVRGYFRPRIIRNAMVIGVHQYNKIKDTLDVC